MWSTEFEWARRFLVAFRRQARDTWAHATQHPVRSAAMTVGGLIAAGAVLWAACHVDLVDRALAAVGG